MRIFIALLILCITTNSLSNVHLRFNTAKENPAYINWNNYQTAYIEFAPPWGDYRTLVGVGYTKPISPKQTVSVSLFSDYMDTIIVDTVYNPLGEIQWTSTDSLYRDHKGIYIAYSYAPFDRLSLGAGLNFRNLKYRNSSPFISENISKHSDISFNLGSSLKINEHKIATNFIGFSVSDLLNFDLPSETLSKFAPTCKFHYRGEYIQNHIVFDFNFHLEYHYSTWNNKNKTELSGKYFESILEGRITQYVSIFGTFANDYIGFALGGNIFPNRKIRIIRCLYEVQNNLGDSDLNWRHTFTTSFEFGKHRNNL